MLLHEGSQVNLGVLGARGFKRVDRCSDGDDSGSVFAGYDLNKDIPYGAGNSIDANTGIQMLDYDPGLKKYKASVGGDREKNVFSNRDYKGFTLFHYQRNGNSIKNVDIKKYFSVENGEVKPKERLDPKKIYEVAKKICDDLYLFVTFDKNDREIIFPMSKWAAEQVFKNGAKIELNKNNHIERILDKDGKQIEPPADDIVAQIQNFFGKHVSCVFPYAYSFMTIHKRTLNYRHKIYDKRRNNTGVVISQMTNELTGRHTEKKKRSRMLRFMKKLRASYRKLQRIKGRTYVYTGSYQLPAEEHMVSFCVVLKRGKALVYMINANGWNKAHDRYALPVKRDFEKYINECIPELKGKVSYRFVNHATQQGPTCMTHADYITRHLAKDPNMRFDGKGVHPMKICLLAVQRGLAVDGLYRPTKEHKKFIPDDIDRVNAGVRKSITNAKPLLDKMKRDAYRVGEKDRYCKGLRSKTSDNIVRFSKKTRNVAVKKAKLLNAIERKGSYKRKIQEYARYNRQLQQQHLKSR